MQHKTAKFLRSALFLGAFLLFSAAPLHSLFCSHSNTQTHCFHTARTHFHGETAASQHRARACPFCQAQPKFLEVPEAVHAVQQTRGVEHFRAVRQKIHSAEPAFAASRGPPAVPRA